MAIRGKLLLLVFGACLAGALASQIECPAFIEQLHDEAEVIQRFKAEIGSGSLESIHQK